MEMLPPAPRVGDVPDDDETVQTTALIAQVPRIALEELARRMLENPGSVSRADFEAALAGHDDGDSTVAFGNDETVRFGDDEDEDEALPAAHEDRHRRAVAARPPRAPRRQLRRLRAGRRRGGPRVGAARRRRRLGLDARLTTELTK